MPSEDGQGGQTYKGNKYLQTESHWTKKKLKTKLRARSPQANYTDRATADCRRS
jgi:hypothetical protein